MEIVKPWLLIATIFFVVGCGSHNWKHDAISQNGWDDDYLSCVQQAETEAGGLRADHPATQTAKTGEIRYLMEKCMKAKGYYRSN